MNRLYRFLRAVRSHVHCLLATLVCAFAAPAPAIVFTQPSLPGRDIITGQVTYSPVNDAWLLYVGNLPDPNTARLFFIPPDTTKPYHGLGTLQASYQANLLVNPGADFSLAFNYGIPGLHSPNANPANTNSGLVVAWSVTPSTPADVATVDVLWHGQPIVASQQVPRAAFGGFYLFDITVTSTGLLTVTVTGTLGTPFPVQTIASVTLPNWESTLTSVPPWLPGLMRSPATGWVNACGALDLTLTGETSPFLTSPLPNRVSNQDFADGFDLTLDTLEGHPEGITVRATSSNPAVFDATNLTITATSPTQRHIALTPKRGGNGTNTVTLSLDPGGGGPVVTTSYVHQVVANVPPSIAIASPLSQPRGFTRAQPITVGSAHWSTDSLQVSVSSLPTNLLDPRSVFIVPDPGGNPALRQLVFTPRLETTGTGNLVLKVTDGSGDSTTAQTAVTTTAGNQAPTVLGAGTALSLNTASGATQYAVDNAPTADMAVGQTVTLEAWVYATALPDKALNFVVNIGRVGQTAAAVLAVMSDGTPSFSNWVNDFYPTNALRKIGLNAWHHLAAVVANQVVTLYVDGQFSASQKLTLTPAIAQGAIYLGHEPIKNGGRHWTGHLDEVRIWNTARTAQEIADTYNRVVRSDSPGLLRYYRFEEGFTPFQGGPGGDPAVTNTFAGRIFDSSLNQQPLEPAGFPAYVPGVPLTTQVDVEQNVASTIGLASVVTGNNAWGNAGVIREIYFGPNSTTLAAGLNVSPGWPDHPDVTFAQGVSVEVAPGGNNRYGERIRGYLVAPETGTYTLAIASAQESQLWLSPDATAANSRLFASSPAAGVSFRQFDANPAQQSAQVTLTAGQRYYFEVRHQAGGDVGASPHLSVQWTLPNGTTESPLPAYRLQPVGTPPAGAITYAAVLAPAWGQVSVDATGAKYQPVANYFGADTFAFTASNGGVTSPAALVQVNVLNRHPEPVAGSGFALSLGGTSGSVQRTPAFDLRGGSFTAEIWARRATADTGLQALFSLQNDASTTQPQATLGWFPGGQVGLQMTQALPGAEVLSSATYLDTDWHHYAAVFDASTGFRAIYRDGVLLGSVTSTNAVVGPGSLFLGSIGGRSGFFQGSLDEFRLWTRARTREELLVTMNTPLVGNEEDLLVYYRFDEGNGLVASDASLPKVGGVSYDGTLTNPVNWTTNAVPFLSRVTVPRNSPGQRIFLPATAQAHQALTYQITGLPQNGGLVADPLVPGAYTYTPSPRYYGSDAIRYTVTAGGLVSAENTLGVDVDFVPIPPTIAPIRDQEFEEEDPALLVVLVATDPDVPDGSRLQFSARSSNPALLPVTNIVFGGSGTNRTVTLDPVAGEVGTSVIEIDVNNGQQSVSTSFRVRVNPRLAYAVVNVGAVANRPSSFATALNAAGQLVGYVAATRGTTNSSGFFYSGFGDTAEAEVFQNLGGNTGSALAVNAAGQVVGAAADAQNATTAFSINPLQDLRPTSLGMLAGGNLSVATDLNDAGLVVGYAEVGGGGFQAVTTSATNTTLTPIPLPATYNSMWATAVNNAGEIAGYARLSAGGATNAFLTANGQTQDLGRPTDTRQVVADQVTIQGLSDQGLLVGTALFASGARSRVVTYQDGVWTNLGDMLGGGSAEATAVNRFGQIVGRALTTNNVWHGFVFTDGRALDLNDLIHGTDWVVSDARGINDRGQIAANGSEPGGANQALLLFPATEIGRRVFRPEGALGVKPDVTILPEGGVDNEANSFFWSAAERKLYAIRPVIAALSWRTGTYVTVTNDTQFGDNSFIRQISTNEVRISTLSFNVWPTDPVIHVAGAPVQVQPDDPGFRHSFVEVLYKPNSAAVDAANKIFRCTLPGYSVLHYLHTDGQTPDNENLPHDFTVVRTVAANDPDFLVTNVLWTVGTAITNALHQDYPGLNGYVLTTNAYFDGSGPDAAYDLARRQGPILPVNSNADGSNFVVVWYRQDRLGTSWASLPYQYALRWPTNVTPLVIASGLGSGPLSPTTYPQMRIYDQPDDRLPGFNPNEEHALLSDRTLYALRNDLNSKIVPHASDPFVLLKYRDPASSDWRLRVFSVVAEQRPYAFHYQGLAGREIQPLPPLSFLPLMTRDNQVRSGPAWKDFHGKIYAAAAGTNGAEGEVVIRYFYPLQPGFFYDLDRNGQPDVAAGSAVPWLDRRTGGNVGDPIDITYSIQWPLDAPVLHVGESTTSAPAGIPDIGDMASAQVVFDSLDPNGDRPLSAGVRLFDPLSPRSIALGNDFQFPDAVRRQADPSTGFDLFPDLPDYLRLRLSYDANNRQLAFRGFVVTPTGGGASITLVNVMSARERDAILALDPSGSAAFRAAVGKLYDLTRNPNRIDLTGDGVPDQALLIGLTTQLSTNRGVILTNVVRETLSGPKALTAAQPLPTLTPRSIPALRFSGADQGLSSSHLYNGISNYFTVEFWVRPEGTMPVNSEATSGVAGTSGQPYAVYPDQGTTVSGLPQRTAVGIAVGTNGVSVFEHADNQLYPTLVYAHELSGWHHVAVVYQDAQPILYVDGLVARVGLRSPNSVQPSAGLVRVKDGYGNYGNFTGSIGDLRVWDHARPQPAIAGNLNARLSGTEPGLIGLWRFEEGSGTAVADASSITNNATLAGTPTWLSTGLPSVPAGPRFAVVAENNDASLGGLPVGLHVIRLDDSLARGSLTLLPPENVLDERLTLRHAADFAGQPENFVFEWYYQGDAANFDPTDVPVTDATGAITDARNWIPYPLQPTSGLGVNDLTLGTGSESSILTLSDVWYVMRFGIPSSTGPTRWSEWIGDPAALAGAPRAMFVPGWIKRVTEGLNLFSQRSSDFLDNAPNTLASAIASAGPRYERDVALNPGQLDNFGLIEIYSTILHRARDLSIDGTPAVAYEPADKALLLAAGSIADLYLLHANEAFADAADPTIGLTTDSTELGSIASSVFAFQNQVDSLLEEELALLRGRDDRFAGVGAPPVYNRLFWNFTGQDGEAAYVATYGIPDQNSDGFVDASDAKILYPQGHGDAWGHYLTALTTYYDLLRHTNFLWQPRPEATLVAGVAIEVNYQDERRFARAAAARAHAGAEIVDRTYRLGYSTDPVEQLLGYADADRNRAWSVTGWARRSAQGALFDWMTGNAILPSVDPAPSHTGIQKVDRTTVLELAQIVSEAASVVAVLDQADAGLNPLGFARGVVPFDIDPDLLRTGFSRSTHFEQIHDRALQALQNAETTFNRASALSSELRKQQNSVSDYSVAVANQEQAYLGDLLGIYGYPYGGDLGPGGAYPAGYTGPDLTHWMYIDTLDLTPANNPPGDELGEVQTSFTGLAANWAAIFSDDTTAALNPTPTNFVLQVKYPVSATSYAFQVPAAWGARRAEGRLQANLRAMVLAQAQLRQTATVYQNLLRDLAAQADLMELRYGLRQDIHTLKQNAMIAADSLNAAIQVAEGIKIAADGVKDDLNEFVDALVEGVPKEEGLSFDALFAVRAAIKLSGNFASSVPEKVSEAAELTTKVLDFAKEATLQALDLQLNQTEQEYDIQQQLKELQGLVRQEAPLRIDVFNANQALVQAARDFGATRAEGDRLLVNRTLFRQVTAGTIQADRYRDLGLRIFRNEALQKYEAQFELASRYVYLASTAYDYELNLGDANGAGSNLGALIVRERNLGELVDGQPVVGRVGLASILGRMRQNFNVLKGQLGLSNDRPEKSRFSLRSEALRILPTSTDTNGTSTATWRQVLQNSVVSNLWDVAEFRRYCRPFAPESAGPQPGIVLRFGTTIAAGQNFFGQPLGPLDSSYDPSEYSTRIKSVAVWFSNYDTGNLAAKPRVYLIPGGTDRLRSANADDFGVRDWQVLDQSIPVPFPIGAADLSTPAGFPIYPALDGTFAAIRRHSAFRAYPDGAFDVDEFNESSRLVGRSVWNTQWVLIIPGTYLLGDPNQGLNAFIQSVDDIKLYFQTYSVSGN